MTPERLDAMRADARLALSDGRGRALARAACPVHVLDLASAVEGLPARGVDLIGRALAWLDGAPETDRSAAP